MRDFKRLIYMFKSLYICNLYITSYRYGLGLVLDTLLPPPILILF